MGLYTLPADNSSKNKTIIKIPGVDGSLHPSSRQVIKKKLVIKILGVYGFYTLPEDNLSKNKTIIKILGVDRSLHYSSRQFI